MPTPIGRNRLELFTIVVGLLGLMLVVMWIQRPGGCALPDEASSALVLSRTVDREHLDTDLASADRVARRYMLATDDPDQQQTRFAECRATLARDIATRHSLSR